MSQIDYFSRNKYSTITISTLRCNRVGIAILLDNKVIWLISITSKHFRIIFRLTEEFGDLTSLNLSLFKGMNVISPRKPILLTCDKMVEPVLSLSTMMLNNLKIKSVRECMNLADFFPIHQIVKWNTMFFKKKPIQFYEMWKAWQTKEENDLYNLFQSIALCGTLMGK